MVTHFTTFVHDNLLQHLMPYNGINPHSVVIMDNCSIHHIPEVVKAIQGVGTLVHFYHPTHQILLQLKKRFLK